MNWTILATLGERAAVAVDSRGLLVPSAGGWSLDWWAGAEDRWHRASREVAVRQRLASNGLSVETLMRVPGGDIVHSAHVCVGPGARPYAVAEVRNDSAVPVALGFAIRPHDLRGPCGSEVAVTLDDTLLSCDGRPAVILPGSPSDTLSGAAAEDGIGYIFPLPHTGRLRVALPLLGDAAEIDPFGLPDADAVARGWRAHLEASTRVVVPDGRVQQVLEVAQRRVLTAGPWLPAWHRGIDRRVTDLDAALVANALAAFGHEREAEVLLHTLGWREPPDVSEHLAEPLGLVASASVTGALAGSEGEGTGDDLAAAAKVVLGIRRIVLNENSDGQLRFLESVPPEWVGQEIEIHDAPTSVGRASVAVRWHGARPALLWSVDGEGPFQLTAAGLDPAWRTSERRGEALLAEFVSGAL